MLGAVLFMGAAAFSSQAATYTYLISGDYADAGVWGSANINSAAYSYGGGLVGKYKDASSGSFLLKRTDGSKTIYDKTLNSKRLTVKNNTNIATKKDRNGLKLTVKVSGKDEKSATIKY